MAKTINLNGHNYTVISPTTQRARRILSAYLRSYDSVLDQVYGRCSQAKRNAYEYCRDREREFGSYDGVITGYNTCTFSYAFTGNCKGKKWLIYITVAGDYAIDYGAI